MNKTNIDTIREAIKDYRIASYEEQKYFEVCDDYELLIGPDGFECALTEPEDRTFYRDLSPVIFELNKLRKALAALSTIDPDAGTGWMIEKSSGIPMWWRGLPKRDGSDSWSSDSLQGIRFVRKVDAEVCALAQGYKLSAVKATDHRWG